MITGTLITAGTLISVAVGSFNGICQAMREVGLTTDGDISKESPMLEKTKEVLALPFKKEEADE